MMDRYKKTTVQIPLETSQKLREYISKHDLTSHDQSKVIVQALNEFFVKDSIGLDLYQSLASMTAQERDKVKQLIDEQRDEVIKQRIEELKNNPRGASC